MGTGIEQGNERENIRRIGGKMSPCVYGVVSLGSPEIRGFRGPFREKAPMSDQRDSDLGENAEPADRSDDGRLMYYEPQLQRSRHYSGRLAGLPEDRVRALYQEVMRYFGSEMPLPPAGLPGHLHAKYALDEPAGELLALGMSYHSAIVFNERRSLHNRWAEARAFIHKIADQARQETWDAVDAERRAEAELRAKESASPEIEQQVYFIGSQSGPIKIGIAANVESRLKGLQTAHHERLMVLATRSGGQPQERAYHAQFAAHRLTGEWFERHPDILAEIDRLSGKAGAA